MPKKTKLIPVSKLRPLFAARGVLIERLELQVEDLKLACAEREKEARREKEEKISALATIKGLERDLDRAISLGEAFQAQVRGYESETAFHMWVRSVKKVFQ